jgi:hypothetical protein
MEKQRGAKTADANIRVTGLEARLIESANKGIELYQAGEWFACQKIMDEILLLEPSDPTAVRYAGLARDELRKSDILEEEVRGMAFLPSLANILVPLHGEGLLYARRASFAGEGLWLSDFWIIHPRGERGSGEFQATGGALGKLVAARDADIPVAARDADIPVAVTNSLIIRDARLAEITKEGPVALRAEARYTTMLDIDLRLAESAALIYSEKIDLNPIELLRWQNTLYKIGWPDVPLWQACTRQLTLPCTVFMMAAIGLAVGWHFRKQYLHRSSRLQIFLAPFLLLPINLFIYTILVRFLDGLNGLLDMWNMAGWILAPVWAFLCLLVSILFVRRALRRG